MSYNPEEILSRLRNQKGSGENDYQVNTFNQNQHQNFQHQRSKDSNQSIQSRQDNQMMSDKNNYDEIYKRISGLESQVQNLSGELQYARQEINVLRNQKGELEDHILKLEVERNQFQNDQSSNNQQTRDQSYIGYELVDAISREPVEKLLQRKEKNFNRFANNPKANKSKPAGHLKLEQLNSILSEYPNLARPIIHIKLTDADFE